MPDVSLMTFSESLLHKALWRLDTGFHTEGINPYLLDDNTPQAMSDED